MQHDKTNIENGQRWCVHLEFNAAILEYQQVHALATTIPGNATLPIFTMLAILVVTSVYRHKPTCGCIAMVIVLWYYDYAVHLNECVLLFPYFYYSTVHCYDALINLIMKAGILTTIWQNTVVTPQPTMSFKSCLKLWHIKRPHYGNKILIVISYIHLQIHKSTTCNTKQNIWNHNR